MATLAPDGSSWFKAFNALNTEVMKKSENKVQFKIYPGGVLGDESDMLRKTKIGQIQGVALSSAGLSSVFNEIDVLQVPFLFQKYEEVDYMCWEKWMAFSERGLRITDMFFWDGPRPGLFTSCRPFRSPAYPI